MSSRLLSRPLGNRSVVEAPHVLATTKRSFSLSSKGPETLAGVRKRRDNVAHHARSAEMTLRLSIENVDRLPDGGPIRIEVKGRGLDLGRDSHLDWTLPDPSRSVSGKHCEIRYRDGGYWLHDVSTNGTFVNGAEYRLDAPHLLRNGDRLSIGPYIIAVAVEEGRKQRSSSRGGRGLFGR